MDALNNLPTVALAELLGGLVTEALLLGILTASSHVHVAKVKAKKTKKKINIVGVTGSCGYKVLLHVSTSLSLGVNNIYTIS